MVEEGVGGEVGALQEAEHGDLPLSHPVSPLGGRGEVNGFTVEAHPPLHVALVPASAHVAEGPERGLPPLGPSHRGPDQLQVLKFFFNSFTNSIKVKIKINKFHRRPGQLRTK